MLTLIQDVGAAGPKCATVSKEIRQRCVGLPIYGSYLS